MSMDHEDEGGVDLGFVHILRAERVYDEEEDRWIEGSALLTLKTVNGVEYGIATWTGSRVPPGMTEEAWTAHRQRLNEISLTHRIQEQLNGS